MRQKEENLTENHTTSMVSKIYVNEENSTLFMNSIFQKAKTKVETSILKDYSQIPQLNCTFMNSISVEIVWVSVGFSTYCTCSTLLRVVLHFGLH